MNVNQWPLTLAMFVTNNFFSILTIILMLVAIALPLLGIVFRRTLERGDFFEARKLRQSEPPPEPKPAPAPAEIHVIGGGPRTWDEWKDDFDSGEI